MSNSKETFTTVGPVQVSPDFQRENNGVRASSVCREAEGMSKVQILRKAGNINFEPPIRHLVQSLGSPPDCDSREEVSEDGSHLYPSEEVDDQD